jgi:hypothetical protein
MLDIGGLLTGSTGTKLFVVLRDSEKNSASGWNLNEDFPHKMWEALEQTISPSARVTILNTLLLRLVRIRQRGKTETLKPTELDPTDHTYGFRVRENTAYDLLLTYFRVTEHGAEPPPIEHQFCLTNPPEEIQASRRFVQINANYRNEQIWFSPRTAGPGPVQLAFEPCRLGDTKVVDQRAAKTIGLKFPVLIEPQTWPKQRRLNLLIGLLCAVLTVWMLRKYSSASEASQKVLVVLIATLASVAINSIKDMLMPKR